MQGKEVAATADAGGWVNDVDDLPVPPQEFISLVVGPSNARDFVAGGKHVANRCIILALRKNGMDLGDFRAILDFGCGCGRLIRHWRHLTGARLYGTDYNPRLVQWCRENLRFAEFDTNQLTPPLAYPDEKFDFIFAGSVFTHFDEALHCAWRDELFRVLMPGGVLAITTHGEHYAKQLPPTLLADFEAGKLVVVEGSQVGKNSCGAFHSLSFLRAYFDVKFEFVDFIPKGWDTQDMVLLRKPLAPRHDLCA